MERRIFAIREHMVVAGRPEAGGASVGAAGNMNMPWPGLARWLAAVALLAMVGASLSGCSRQSVTDFTPYPAMQAPVQLVLALGPASFTVDGQPVQVDRVKVYVKAVRLAVTGGTARTSRRAALVAHATEDGHDHHGHGTGDESAETAAFPDDPNRLPADDRPLVPEVVAVEKVCDLATPTIVAEMAVRAGVAPIWELHLSPGDLQALEPLSLLAEGTIGSGAQVVPWRLELDHEQHLTFPTGSALPAGAGPRHRLRLLPAHWFEGIGLWQMAQSGPVTIDHRQSAVQARCAANVRQAVEMTSESRTAALDGHDHAHDHDHDQAHEDGEEHDHEHDHDHE
ncbi:MAG: hypothetical protein OZSIB_0408 [Candidatus Ozemobacter sibiricus]|jgi:hypothetical protein|uniref:Uncharacterized protein n=1 Tax=Candidatus Ozemobacter sibiricus TaxID=2268124 RepID=A0A367ZM15_9BACT|nr:MAG: hypothetical protein OZSIB_0408 [Candidatus Ozemobacter sibiricus]